MNSLHDMGGTMNYGPVHPELDEPIFHADWERKALALTVLMGASGQTPPEMQVLLDFYKAFGSVVYDAHATERGVVMSTRMTLR